MHRLMIILFGVISTVTVAILLFLLYRYAAAETRREVPNSLRTEPRISLKNVENERHSLLWIRSLALKKRPSYSYPVSEMKIELPLKKKGAPQKVHRLSLENIDDYKMFCIEQLLRRTDREYSLYRRKNKAVVMIRSGNPKTLSKIVSTFKEYDIPAKIEK